MIHPDLCFASALVSLAYQNSNDIDGIHLTMMSGSAFQPYLLVGLQLQDELIQKMKGNEKAYEQAKNLEAMFKSVKDEYDATVPIVKEFQKQALNGK